MSPNDAQAPRVREAVQVCPACDRVGSACPIEMGGASPGVQYWRCEVCAIIRATRADGRLAAASG
jgi:formate dehydrogenase maturation protein FdhE